MGDEGVWSLMSSGGASPKRSKTHRQSVPSPWVSACHPAEATLCCSSWVSGRGKDGDGGGGEGEDDDDDGDDGEDGDDDDDDKGGSHPKGRWVNTSTSPPNDSKTPNSCGPWWSS